jgi:hypothetical protein
MGEFNGHQNSSNVEKSMSKGKAATQVNPLIQDDLQDTLFNASAVIYCLQHMRLDAGLDDEGELGMNLILETVRNALRYEALGRRSQKD